MSAPKPSAAGVALSTLNVPELLGLWNEVMRELTRRSVIRSGNNPIGDYAEGLVAAHYGVALAANSTTGYDLITGEGVRVQVKCRRQTPSSRPQNFSPLRGMDADEPDFDLLVAVLLGEDFGVVGAWSAPFASVRQVARWRPRMNAHLLYLRDVQKDERFTPFPLGLMADGRPSGESPDAFGSHAEAGA